MLGKRCLRNISKRKIRKLFFKRGKIVFSENDNDRVLEEICRGEERSCLTLIGFNNQKPEN